MVVSCLGTGYLEESYFRYYLLSKLDDIIDEASYKANASLPRVIMTVCFSTFLFSVCHIYEGPWGIVNSSLAGALLSALFIRFKSLHGIAWAHGAYNIFVYVMGNFI
jgi:membrane protease YdiL (CAAX protease family)